MKREERSRHTPPRLRWYVATSEPWWSPRCKELIGYSDEAGKGTTFTIDFPLHTVLEEADAKRIGR